MYSTDSLKTNLKHFTWVGGGTVIGINIQIDRVPVNKLMKSTFSRTLEML